MIWPLSEWAGRVWEPVVKTKHEQNKYLKNRMLKKIKASGVWPLRIERGRNSQLTKI